MLLEKLFFSTGFGTPEEALQWLLLLLLQKKFFEKIDVYLLQSIQNKLKCVVI